MSDIPSRRELRFSNFDQVLEDVENLRARGYTQTGKWDLAQACGHLAEWFLFPVNGFPKSGILMTRVWWLLRLAIGKTIRKRMLTQGVMPSGKPTLPSTVMPTGADAAEAIDKFKMAMRKFIDHPGEYASSPFFGVMNREEWALLERIHCALHLSFLIPKTN